MPDNQMSPPGSPPPRCPTALAHLNVRTPTSSEIDRSVPGLGTTHDFSLVRGIERNRGAVHPKDIRYPAENDDQGSREAMVNAKPTHHRIKDLLTDEGRASTCRQYTGPGGRSQDCVPGSSSTFSITTAASDLPASPLDSIHADHARTKLTSRKENVTREGCLKPPTPPQLPAFEGRYLGTPIPAPDPITGEIQVFEYPHGHQKGPKAIDTDSLKLVTTSDPTTSTVKPYQQLLTSFPETFYNNFFIRGDHHVSSQEYSKREYDQTQLDRSRSWNYESRRSDGDVEENSSDVPEQYDSFPRDMFAHAFIKPDAGSGDLIEDQTSLPLSARWKTGRRPISTLNEPSFQNTHRSAKGATTIRNSHGKYDISDIMPSDPFRESESTRPPTKYNGYITATETRNLNTTHGHVESPSLTPDETFEYGSPTYMNRFYDQGLDHRINSKMELPYSDPSHSYSKKSMSQNEESTQQDELDGPVHWTHHELNGHVSTAQGHQLVAQEPQCVWREDNMNMSADTRVHTESNSLPMFPPQPVQYPKLSHKSAGSQYGEPIEQPARHLIEAGVTRHEYSQSLNLVSTALPWTNGQPPYMNWEHSMSFHQKDHRNGANELVGYHSSYSDDSIHFNSPESRSHQSSTHGGNQSSPLISTYSPKQSYHVQKPNRARTGPHKGILKNNRYPLSSPRPNTIQTRKPPVSFAESPVMWKPPRGPSPHPNMLLDRDTFNPSYVTTDSNAASESLPSQPVTPPFPPLFGESESASNNMATVTDTTATSVQCVDRNQIKLLNIRRKRASRVLTFQGHSPASGAGWSTCKLRGSSSAATPREE
ncbi:hypothetical protein P154DRAFT_567087, partial [Amniculicola lignicola CBS 123094]